MKEHVSLWESLEEMLAACDAAYQAGRACTHWTRADFIGREFEGWEDVREAARAEWPEGMDLVASMAEELASSCQIARPRSRRRVPRWAEDGDEFDRERWEAGREDCWRVCRREAAAAPSVITLVFNVSTRSGVGPGAILWRGAAALALADVLEREGYRVEVWGVNCATRCYQSGAGVFHAVRVKAASAPLDLAALASAVSGWFYRTVFFQSYRCEEKRGQVRPSLGRPACLTSDHPSVAALAQGGPCVVIDNVFDRSAALELARRVVEELS